MLKQAVAGWRKAFGDDHPGTFQSLRYLGQMYISHGRYAEGHHVIIAVSSSEAYGVPVVMRTV